MSVNPAERAEMWRRVHELGAAGAICDQIVRSRPVPAALLIALHEAPHLTEQEIGALKEPSTCELNSKEHQIMQHVARGEDNAEIADKLGLPLETLKSDVRRILLKLKARNRTHAVAIAVRAGIIN